MIRKFLLIVAAAAVLLACGSPAKGPAGPEDVRLLDQVDRYLEAIESGEMVRVDRTVHPASPFRDQIMLEAEGYIRHPDKLDFTLDRDQSQVLARTAQEAYLYVTWDLKGSVENTTYRPNRSTLYLRLAKEGDFWYLVQSVTEKMEFTDLDDIREQIDALATE